MIYLYLITFILCLAAIWVLLSSKKIQKKYDKKRASAHLLGIMLTMSMAMCSYSELKSDPYSTLRYVSVFIFICIAVLAPIYIATRYKDRAKMNKKDSWIYIFINIGIGIIAFLSVFWIMFFATSR